MRLPFRLVVILMTAIAPATLSAPPAAADVLVLRASGPSSAQYRAGTRLPTGARLQLRSGDQLLLLDGRGTRRLRGPTSWAVGSRWVAPAQVNEAFRQRDSRVRVSVAATRNADILRANEIDALTSRATAAIDRGEFAVAERLLTRIERMGIDHRVQCRLVSNLRLSAALASGRPPRPAALADQCGRHLVPPGFEAVQAELDADRVQLLEAAEVLREAAR